MIVDYTQWSWSLFWPVTYWQMSLLTTTIPAYTGEIMDSTLLLSFTCRRNQKSSFLSFFQQYLWKHKARCFLLIMRSLYSSYPTPSDSYSLQIHQLPVWPSWMHQPKTETSQLCEANMDSCEWCYVLMTVALYKLSQNKNKNNNKNKSKKWRTILNTSYLDWSLSNIAAFQQVLNCHI